MMQRRHFLALALAATSALTLPALAQTAPDSAQATAPVKAMDRTERQAVLRDLADSLENNFVFPDIGSRYATLLRQKAEADAYADLTDPVAFGERVTADLQAVAKDGHLRLAPQEVFASRAPRRPAPDAPASTKASGPPGLEETKMIGDVAYLRFNAFMGDEGMIARARGFLLDNAGKAKAVIIDARPHRGGGLAEMDAILPLLYAQPTTLVRMDTRASAFARGMPPFASLVNRVAPDGIVRQDHTVTPDLSEMRLQSVPVYYLTSRRSASAAEHLALAFKRTKRATLVGEKTAGAGHYGGVEPVGERFGAFIPVGRTYNPDNDWGWEGQGVAPDVETPADDALAKALELAGKAGAHPA
ncbi:S41 family peptidase [Niveispirillum cyanobacteriorum]|nr:S41 family peptidase [Niveispirillum cyanobacteriorum]GGE81014.1 interphotoreceptor retinoid-binding protein [Niveispirillum cyanobacteriorum]